MRRYFSLLVVLWRPGFSAKETAEQNSKSQESSFTLFLLVISVLLCHKYHFRQTCHHYSSAQPCVACTCILLAVFCYQILSLCSEMSKIHLMEGSDRWNNIFYFNLIWNFLMNVLHTYTYIHILYWCSLSGLFSSIEKKKNTNI